MYLYYSVIFGAHNFLQLFHHPSQPLFMGPDAKEFSSVERGVLKQAFAAVTSLFVEAARVDADASSLRCALLSDLNFNSTPRHIPPVYNKILAYIYIYIRTFIHRIVIGLAI